MICVVVRSQNTVPNGTVDLGTLPIPKRLRLPNGYSLEPPEKWNVTVISANGTILTPAAAPSTLNNTDKRSALDPISHQTFVASSLLTTYFKLEAHQQLRIQDLRRGIMCQTLLCFIR